MRDTTHTRWLITGPAELLAVVPYLLGFHPTDGDAVIIAFHDRRVLCAARTDLPAPGTSPTLLRAHLAGIATTFTQAHATSIILVGYGSADRVTPVTDATLSVADATGLRVRDVLRVADGRYYACLCDNPVCCPPEGQPFDPAGSLVAAQATFNGFAPLPDRQSLVDLVNPVTGAARDAMLRAAQHAHLRLTRHLDTWRATPTDTLITDLGQSALDAALADPRRWPLPDDEAAWLILLLAHDQVRDTAWLHTAGHPEHLALWLDLTRRAAVDLLGNTAGICALSAFEQGKDVLGHAALDRIVRDHPTHPLAGIDDLLIDVDPQGRPQTTDA